MPWCQLVVQELGSCLRQAMWPVLVGVLVWVFLDQLKELFSRLKRLAVLGLSLEAPPVSPGARGVGAGPRSAGERVPAEVRLGSGVDRQAELPLGGRFGNIYWLGYDIFFAIAALTGGGQKQTVVTALEHSLYHARALGLNAVGITEKTEKLVASVKDLPAASLDGYQRGLLAAQVVRLRDEVGAHMEVRQPGFGDGWTEHEYL